MPATAKASGSGFEASYWSQSRGVGTPRQLEWARVSVSVAGGAIALWIISCVLQIFSGVPATGGHKREWVWGQLLESHWGCTHPRPVVSATETSGGLSARYWSK